MNTLRKFPIRIYVVLMTLIALNPATVRAENMRSVGQSVSIIGVTAFDSGSISEDSPGDIALDVIQNVCETIDDVDILEPFYDSILAIDLKNHAPMDARISRIRYVVTRVGGKRRFRSIRVAPTGSVYLPADQTGRLFFLFLHSSNGTKRFAGGLDPIDAELGFKNVRISVKGRLSNGSRFRKRIRSGFHFGDFDRCT